MPANSEGAAEPCSTRLLFGGAMQMKVPDSFADVSAIRQIPDNQEVFAHAESDRSVVVELLQSENSVPAQEARPASFHWDVLIHDSGAINSSIWEREEVANDLLAANLIQQDGGVHASVVTGEHRVAKYRDTADRANNVSVCLACIRLPRAATDVLVVVNEPTTIHPESSSAMYGSAVGEGLQRPSTSYAILRSAISSIEVLDWSLFRDS